MKNKLSRRKFLLAFLGISGIGIGGGAYAYTEPNWLEVKQDTVRLVSDQLPDPITILHLSDFHASRSVSYDLIEKACAVGLEQKPNLICLTGDFITRELRGFDRYRQILQKLSDSAPTFACLGNHDGGDWSKRHGGQPDSRKVKKLLRESGVSLLINQSHSLKIQRQALEIVGLGDLWANQLSPQKTLSTIKQSDRVVIVLSHNPDSKEFLSKYHWDLMLCGHTHGGQLKLPFIGTPFAPVRDHRYVEGLHLWQNKWLHITRGVGSLYGLRINCRPQVSLLKLEFSE